MFRFSNIPIRQPDIHRREFNYRKRWKQKEMSARRICLGGVIHSWICKRYSVRRLTREELPYGRSHPGYGRAVPGVPECMCNLRVSWYSGIYSAIKYRGIVSKIRGYREMKVLEEISFTMFLPLDVIGFFLCIIILYCIILYLAISDSRYLYEVISYCITYFLMAFRFHEIYVSILEEEQSISS